MSCVCGQSQYGVAKSSSQIINNLLDFASKYYEGPLKHISSYCKALLLKDPQWQRCCNTLVTFYILSVPPEGFHCCNHHYSNRLILASLKI